MHLPRALLLALMLTTGIVAVVAYSQAGASLPAVGAVVASDEALLALACAGDGESAQGAPADPICQVEGGRLVLDFSKYADLVPGEPGGYDLEELEVGTQYGSPAPSNHWYAYVYVKGKGDDIDDGKYYFEQLDVAQSHNHSVEVVDYGLDKDDPNCVWIEWHQPKPQGWTGVAKICLPPRTGSEPEIIYGFQPGSQYDLDDLFTVTNNSNARYVVTMKAEGSLDHRDLGVKLSSGGIEFYPEGGQVTLGPGETIPVTVSFDIDDDWPEGSTTLNGRFIVTAEVDGAP